MYINVDRARWLRRLASNPREGGLIMAEAKTKLPVKGEGKQAEQASALREWRPSETLRREIDRVFDDFGGGFWRSPFRRSVFDG